MNDNTSVENSALQEEITQVLKEIYDPEIPVNIYDLGLIYSVEVTPELNVNVKMTLTTPACPVAQTFPLTVMQRVKENVEGVNEVYVDLVWDPPWTQDMMSEAAKLQLGML
jgi:FeS assembly SUF system protein